MNIKALKAITNAVKEILQSSSRSRVPNKLYRGADLEDPSQFFPVKAMLESSDMYDASHLPSARYWTPFKDVAHQYQTTADPLLEVSPRRALNNVAVDEGKFEDVRRKILDQYPQLESRYNDLLRRSMLQQGVDTVTPLNSSEPGELLQLRDYIFKLRKANGNQKFLGLAPLAGLGDSRGE